MKKITATLMAMAILTLSPMAMAATKTCEVVSITDTEVLLNCKNVKGLTVGEKVKIKTLKKTNAIEGC